MENQAQPTTTEQAPATSTNTPTAGGNQSGIPQEELDRQFAERAKRAAEAERKKIMEALGVKDDAELKAIVEAKRKDDEARKSEIEKLADQAKKAEEKAGRLETESAQKLAAMSARLLDNEIKMTASKPVLDKDGKVLRPAFRAEALDDIPVLLNRSKIEDKDGKFEGVEAALAELAKTKPYLLAESTQNGIAPKGTPQPQARRAQPQAQQPARPSWTL